MDVKSFQTLSTTYYQKFSLIIIVQLATEVDKLIKISKQDTYPLWLDILHIARI